jgi:exonuclease VII small subunit
MNNRSFLLAKCLDGIARGEMSLEECTRQYPQIAQELQLASRLRSGLGNEYFGLMEQKRQRMVRSRVMAKLPERSTSVTNLAGSRYTLQNLNRRFAMSWIIIITTVLSLVSGGGIVYASNNALPGEVLYPLKTWIEDVRLAVASDDADVGLHFEFSETRLEEILALLEEGDLEELEGTLGSYENHVKLMTQIMAKIQAQDPEQAIRLRTDLESKLQEQSRRMEDQLDDTEEVDAYVQERLREMLETNTQLRERAQEVDEEPIGDEDTVDSTQTELDGSNEPADAIAELNSSNVSGGVDAAANGFKFNLDGRGKNGVYAVVSGTRFECVMDGDVAICPAAGAPEKGSVQLFDKQTNQLLFAYAYEYAFAYDYSWQGENDDNGNNGGSGDSNGDEGGGNQNNNGN